MLSNEIANYIVEYMDITFHYVSPPLVELVSPSAVASDKRRVLISKAGSEAYPSTSQTTDGEIEIVFKVTRDSKPSPDEMVYFLAVDPPDEPPLAGDYYIPPDTRLPNDNKDVEVGAGTLSASQVVTGADGLAKVKLKITSRIAGDNYAVKASLDERLLQNDPTVQRVSTPVLTAWKRVYVEIDRMMKAGTYLTSAVAPGATELTVLDTNGFSKGQIVLLMHAPPVVGNQKTFYQQEVLIKQVDSQAKVLKLDVTNPAYRVTAPFAGPEPFQEVDRSYLADAVARPASGWYDVNTSTLAESWNLAFTDVQFVSDDPVPYVPYEAAVDGHLVEQTPATEIALLAQKWEYHDGDANHLHLIAAARHADVNELGEATSRYFGTTIAWIFQNAINANAPASGEWNLNAEATVHEMTHVWQVEHCSHQKEFNSTKACNMTEWT